MIGFPLRLLAREVYDKVCAIKGPGQVALITGEERIEPKDARWLLCTVEAMPVRGGDRSASETRGGRQAGSANQGGADLAFVALDEAQLAADRERGHIFTDRLLHARGREETMLLGSATMAPMVRALVPEAEIVSRPRFSTLSHVGARKLSRIPPRSVIVAFSAEQVYAVAEMLRRFRGGAAVVMGALSPETRNRQVALYQSGEVDYLVATDAVGMGLNLDVGHVAFAGLSKFDGVRQRRLTPAEMAQIAGRAGRHQRDGTFGTLSGSGGHDSAFTDEEVYAIEEHRFAPVPRLYWREAEPGFESLADLIADLETPPDRPELVAAPQAIDLAVLKRLADEPGIAGALRTPAQIQRFWQVCSLPDFRHSGEETHARFVARLWEELKTGTLGADHTPRAIAQLDNVSGDIDTLQGRIAAVRSWSYITQRPDWVPARAEMAERARAVEARLSDALHARLTERFVNRRTTVLMRQLGPDAALLPVCLDGDTVLVEGEAIGELVGLRFRVDPEARHGDHKLLLAAAERHLPALLATRAEGLIAALAARGEAAAASGLALRDGVLEWHGERLARLSRGKALLTPAILPDAVLDPLPAPARTVLLAALAEWLARRLRPLAPLAHIEAASTDAAAGPELRALLIRLAEGGGMIARADSRAELLDKRQRDLLRRLGVVVGALDLFHPALLRRAPLRLWRDVTGAPTSSAAPIADTMPPVRLRESLPLPLGYRAAGEQWLRLDIAEALLREAHGRRAASRGRSFPLDPAGALASGLTTASYARLLRQAGFRPIMPRALPAAAFGPPAPLVWRWQPPRRENEPTAPPPAGGAFAALARLVA
jgi:ATP-dependent RNA helicase SUPV3L1/SUV3